MRGPRGTILIVDDTLENLQVLGEMLELDGHEVRIASEGAPVPDLVRRNPPDLILLDVMMPDVDGHEVCRRLKSDPATAEVPVIFLTALSDEANEARGFDLGAVDYITKPFKMNLVRKRVRTHLWLRQLQVGLQESNLKLEEQVAARTRDLTEANRRLTALDATKTRFLHLLVQEVQAPTNSMVGVGQLALVSIEDQGKRQRLQGLFEGSRNRLAAILDRYQKLVALQESDPRGRLHPVSLEETVATVWKSSPGLGLPALPDRSYIVASDPGLLADALAGLWRWLTQSAVPGSPVEAQYAEDTRTVSLSLRVSSSRPRPSHFLPVDEFRGQGDDLPLAAVVLGALGVTASLGPGPGSTWELRLTLPAYAP